MKRPLVRARQLAGYLRRPLASSKFLHKKVLRRLLEKPVALRYSGYRSRMIRIQPRNYLLLMALVVCHVRPALALQKAPTLGANVVVTGHLVCLDGSLRETACAPAPGTFGLKVHGDKIYPLRKHENVDALFVEKRLQTRDFKLTLRKEAEPSPWFELVKAQLIRGGKVYDFYYFCDVCNITTHAPGICLCCRQETDYRESLAE